MDSKELKLVELLSHDISNPLLVIQGQLEHHIEALKEEGKEVPKFLIKIATAADHIEEILTLVKELKGLESGKINLTIEKVDLGKMINDINLIFEEKLKEKQIKLNIIKNSDDLNVMANGTALQHQIINNLISNAIKFSQKKSTIDFVIDEEDGFKTIAIKDHGIGVPPDLLKKLFMAEEKTSRRGTDGEKGTGFGLPLAKKYLELFEGKITVESKEKVGDSTDHGSTFKLFLKKA